MSENLRKYKVIIPYSEPTYEVHRGSPRKSPCIAPYQIFASSEEEAIKEALKMFEYDVKHSHVGWLRIPDYTGIRVEIV